MAINKFVSTRNRNKNRNRLIPLMGGLDDGSTLSLDFTTMSSLDSRFTFSRSSPATFINSSGLVKYADHELYLNTQFTGLNATPSQGWGFAFNAGGGSILFAEETGEVIIDAISGRRGISRTSSVAGTNGRKMIASVDVTVTAGSLNPSDLIQEGSATNKQWYIGSTLYTSGTVPLNTPVTISLVFDSAANTNVYFGIGMNNTTSGTATFKNPRMQFYSGTLPAPVVGNTSTSASKLDTPRFDYDPTTLAPRGLLIEGSATNGLLRSNAFNTSPWTITNFNTPSIASPAVTDPAGGTDTWYGVPSGIGTVYHGFRYSFTFTAAAYTFSIWAKAAQHDKFIISDLTNGIGACRFDLTAKTATVIAGTVTPTNPQIVQYPNGWFRCSFTMQMSAITTGISWSSYPTGATTTQYGAQFTATGTDGMYFYGAQLELGSGATSYIPTGSSTVQRAADSCSIAMSSFAFSQFGGTFFVRADRGNFGVGGERSVIATPYGSGLWLGVFTPNASSVVYLMDWNTTSLTRGVGSTQNKIAYSYGQTTGSGATLQLPVSLAVNGSDAATGTFGNGTSNGANVANPANLLSSPLTLGAVAVSPPYTTSTGAWLNNCIQQLKYWPTRLSDAQLKSLTQ